MINLEALVITFSVCCVLASIGVVVCTRRWYKHWNERWSDTEEETDEAFAAAVQAAEIRQREEKALTRESWGEKKGETHEETETTD